MAESPYYVAVVPINEFEQVLIGKRKEDGIWTTPAGGANENESPEDCAVRECFEEAGLLVDKSRLELIKVKNALNGKPVHCYLYRTTQSNTHVAHDPDREVDEWLWTSASQLPKELSRKKNQNRLETINEAYMKYHGLTKSKWLEVGMKVEMEHTKDKEEAKKIAQDHLNEDPDYYKDWDNKEKILFQPKAPKIKKSEIELLIDKLEKGGPGSGKKGHKTNRDNVVSLNTKLQQKEGDVRTKLHDHLDKLKSGAVLENAKTESGKPIPLSMEAATAHGYTEDDHKDAMNVHYDIAQKWAQARDKYKGAGHKIPEQVEKIIDIHQKAYKAHFRARQQVADRKAKTEEAMKQQRKSKADASNKVKKSVTQMGHQESADLNTADYAMALKTSNDTPWLGRLYDMMEGYDYGDAPRELMLDKGMISLVKVDDGQYTGFFRRLEDGMEDNAKIRIERITMPDLVQLLLAKEWINPMEVANDDLEGTPEVTPEPNYGALDAKLQEMSDQVDGVVEQGIDTERILDKKIHMLELMNKLLN